MLQPATAYFAKEWVTPIANGLVTLKLMTKGPAEHNRVTYKPLRA